MRDEAIQLVRDVTEPAQAMNILREFLQALVLRSLHESEAFTKLAFVGGTALRFIHGVPRFSEDLDFSLEQSAGYEPESWMRKVKRDLELAGLDVSINWNAKSTVHKAWLKWEGILREAGLSPHAGQKLAIKMEIDTRPPAGAVCERRVVTRHRLLALNLHNLPSLMAGKTHAIITRSYPKGRDWYDLLWYLGHRPVVEPNPVQLQNALDQTQGIGALSAADWRSLAMDRLRRVDAAQLATDVAPFLEHRNDASVLTTENLGTALRWTTPPA